jgi:hypothetical protein
MVQLTYPTMAWMRGARISAFAIIANYIYPSGGIYYTMTQSMPDGFYN